MIFLYLITLIIAPQLWIEPFVGLRTDVLIYPLWFVVIVLSGKMNYFFKFKSIDYFILLFIFWVILSAIVNDQNEFTTKIIVDYIKWFILYRLIVTTIGNDIDKLKSVVLKMLFLIYIIVWEGIEHKFSSNGIGWAGQPLGWVDQSVLDAGGTGRTQWINIFDGPGVFCVLYTVALPFIIQYFDKHYSSKKKLFALIALIPLLMAIWYTGSRGGLLATLGIFASYGVIRVAKTMGISISRILFMGALSFSVLMLAPSHLTQVKDDNNSAQHRVDMWMQGIEMVQQNPLFGIGKGNYASYTGTLIAHNSSIENMGELGMPGLFFWVGFLYIAFRYLYLFSSTSTNPLYISYSNATALSLIGYLLSSMFVTLEYETMYFLLALASVFGNAYGKEIKIRQKDYVIIGSICIGWVFLLKVFVSLYY